MINCPAHGATLSLSGGSYTCPQGCRYASPAVGVIDLIGEPTTQTAEHYSLQWGAEVDFASFYRGQRSKLTAMTSRQMGWPSLIERIRRQSETRSLSLFDAACGYGGLFMDLFEDPAPSGLRYVGADIHGALASIARPAGAPADRATFVRWDISKPLPTGHRFDVVICRAAIHHTPEPRTTFRSLVERLASGGTLAITAYARKAPMREATDDALRERIVPMPPREALALARQFTNLGRDLQQSDGMVEITEDLPFLNIKAGRYRIQEFIYDHFLKCWFNQQFGDRYSDVVNFDWYHPPYAYRYDVDELKQWFVDAGLEVVDVQSTTAQHYLEGRLKK